MWSPKLNEKSVDFTNQKSTILFRNRYQILTIPPPPALWPFAKNNFLTVLSDLPFVFLMNRVYFSQYSRCYADDYRSINESGHCYIGTCLSWTYCFLVLYAKILRYLSINPFPSLSACAIMDLSIGRCFGYVSDSIHKIFSFFNRGVLSAMQI